MSLLSEVYLYQWHGG